MVDETDGLVDKVWALVDKLTELVDKTEALVDKLTEWIIFISMLFIAADEPPRDLSRGAYVFFTIVIPICFGICVFVVYYGVMNLLKFYKIDLSKWGGLSSAR